ncbi:hypothetical protein ANAEL_00820 [Anaerolineales bacterium]|nr:hypothetical protein ANAEL_00820 [Anaerolineales bacterium]
MPTPIQPTAQHGQKRVAERQARQVWSQLQPEAWNALTANQRWEIVRRVLLYVLRREFNDLRDA